MTTPTAPARAAGVLFLSDANEVLLCHRTDGQGWAFPGGGIEDGETAEEAARREVAEETGLKYDGELTVWTRRVKDGVDFTTHLGRIAGRFDPALNHEHDACQWLAPAQALALEDLHPGARIALTRFDLDELGVAKAVRDGELQGPQRVGDCWLVALRITGTGASYRPQLKEFTWRDPALYLNDEFLQRCNGLPVILDHPENGTLNSKEYAERSVGSIFLPYIQGSEVWGIAKIYDAATIALMEREQLSTSPMVETDGPKIKLEDGKHVLLEEKPDFISHVAICDVGVWDKGGPPSGIQSSTSPGDTHMAEEAPVRTEPTEEGKKLDAILGHLTGLHEKHDKLADAVAEHTKRLDELEKPEEEEPAVVAADSAEEKARKDAEEKAKADAAAEKCRADSAVRENAELKGRLESIEQKIKDMPEDERSRYVGAQQRADRVAQAFGDSARRWLSGEKLAAYRRALAQPFQKHSAAWKDIDLSTLPDNALDIAEKQIYADSWAAATKPSVLNAAQGLREVIETDRGNRRISKFYGDTEECWAPFKAPAMSARFRRPGAH